MSKSVITILGGGNAAHAAASVLGQKDYDIRMYEDEKFAKNMQIVFDTKQVEYTGVFGEGTVKLSMVTSNLKEAVAGAKIILVIVPAFAHKSYADKLVQYLEDGQTVLIFAGTFGSLLFWKAMKTQGIKKDVVFAETYTSAYDARLSAPGKVQIMGKHDPLKTGVMPAKKTEQTMEVLKDLFPVAPAKSVIDSGLFTLNPVVHVPGCIMNAGRIELMKGEFWFYKEGITPCVGYATEQLDAERVAIINKLGYKALSVVESLGASDSTGNTIYEAITSNAQFAKIKGPDGLKNRYYTEDIPYGLVPWALLAHSLGVKTPIMDAFITIGNLILGENSWETGRTMKDLGIDGMSVDELHNFLQNG